MQKDIARAALIFLQRCDLKGSEAPAMMAVVKALEDIVNASEASSPPPG